MKSGLAGGTAEAAFAVVSLYMIRVGDRMSGMYVDWIWASNRS